MTYQPQHINCETGVLFGLKLSITSGSTTEFDLSSGKVCIVDWTGVSDNLGKSRSQVLTYLGETSITPPSAAANIFTGLFITESSSAGIALLEQVPEALYDNETRRDKVALPIVLHQDGVGNISGFSEDIQLSYEWHQQLNDLVHIVGITSTGNRYSSGVSGNFVNREEGSGARLHFNAFNDTKNPISRSSSAVSGVSLFYTKQVSGGGSGEFTGTFRDTIDPEQYDNNGTLTAVPINDFTIQTIFFFPQSSTQTIAYGQSTYNTLLNAENAIDDGTFDDEFAIPPNTIAAVKVTYLIVQQGTTDLNSELVAKFKQFRNILVKENGG